MYMIERKWWYGGPWEIWVKRIDMIRTFITEQKLHPIAAEDLPVHPMFAEAATGGASGALRPRPFPGGLRSPHLHLKGEVFLMNPEQWKAFSTTMLKQYQDRLGRAGTVGFDQFMDIAESMEAL